MNSKYQITAYKKTNIISETIRIFLANFSLFFQVLIPPTAFVTLALLVNEWSMDGDLNSSALGLQVLFIAVIYLLSLVYTYIALSYAAAYAIVEEPVHFTEIYNLISFRKTVRLFGTLIMKSVLIGIGFLFFILPGFYLTLAFSFAELMVLFEDKGVFDALARSREIIRTDFWGFFWVVTPFLGAFLLIGFAYKALFSFLIIDLLGNLPGEGLFIALDIFLGNLLLPLSLTFFSLLYLVYAINEEGLTKTDFLAKLGH